MPKRSFLTIKNYFAYRKNYDKHQIVTQNLQKRQICLHLIKSHISNSSQKRKNLSNCRARKPQPCSGLCLLRKIIKQVCTIFCTSFAILIRTVYSRLSPYTLVTTSQSGFRVDFCSGYSST